MEELTEIRRLGYGGVGLLVGITLNRVAGLHIVLHSISVENFTSANTAWFVVFCLGILVGALAPAWFWLARPMLTGGRDPPEDPPSERTSW